MVKRKLTAAEAEFQTALKAKVAGHKHDIVAWLEQTYREADRGLAYAAMLEVVRGYYLDLYDKADTLEFVQIALGRIADPKHGVAGTA